MCIIFSRDMFEDLPAPLDEVRWLTFCCDDFKPRRIKAPVVLVCGRQPSARLNFSHHYHAGLFLDVFFGDHHLPQNMPNLRCWWLSQFREHGILTACANRRRAGHYSLNRLLASNSQSDMVLVLDFHIIAVQSISSLLALFWFAHLQFRGLLIQAFGLLFQACSDERVT
jgi:hypothetical protein